MPFAKLASTRPLYNWNRYYDPKIGRYVTSDPIGLLGGLNSFSYARSNPVYWIDPLGLMETWGPGDSPVSVGSSIHVLPVWMSSGNSVYSNTVMTMQGWVPTGFYPGSTLPDPDMPRCSKGCPQILPGRYPFQKKNYKGNYPALEINGGGYVATIGQNPNQSGKQVMNGAWFHRGWPKRRYSEGCLTLDPDYYDSFIDNVGQTGNITVW